MKYSLHELCMARAFGLATVKRENYPATREGALDYIMDKYYPDRPWEDPKHNLPWWASLKEPQSRADYWNEVANSKRRAPEQERTQPQKDHSRDRDFDFEQ